ncbi:hypothetical protein GCM10027427_35480 [Pseudoclavibacter terrae]
MANNDPRYLRSRLEMRSAALEIARRDPTDLSVTSVCKTSGVDRMTFYRHFASLDALVADAMGDHAERAAAAWEAIADGSGEQENESTQLLTTYLDYIEENQELYRWALSEAGSIRTLHEIRSRFARAIEHELELLAPSLPTEERALRASYAAGGMLGACMHWLSSSPRTPTSELATRLIALSRLS